jgi:aerobic-type carbon monoxide dehydrogenase small subunit (CoxS/CutS family)
MKTDTEAFGSRDERLWSPEPPQPRSCSAVSRRLRYPPRRPTPEGAVTPVSVELRVNGQPHRLTLDPSTPLLDALGEHLALTGSKKGCDHGQCGACTMLLDGRRINSCLTLTAMHDAQPITTIEGLVDGEKLHPPQAAFIDHDGFQCGYCTSGQICSAIGMLSESRVGAPSYVTENPRSGPRRCAQCGRDFPSRTRRRIKFAEKQGCRRTGHLRGRRIDRQRDLQRLRCACPRLSDSFGQVDFRTPDASMTLLGGRS